MSLVAVIDIGKTHSKLMLTDRASGRETWAAQRASRSLDGADLLELDVAGTAAWLLQALAEAPDRAEIEVIVPVAHGAAMVFLDAAGAIVAAPDYEDARFDDVARPYAGLRDSFEQTFSPNLPLGLNAGRQIYYLRERLPDRFARVAHILPFPQYWAWLLSGVLASEVTSLGCHTDLWLPRTAMFSPLAEREGWAALFPPRRPASDVLGTLRPDLATRCGLDPACTVLCGIHDSNASYLRHRVSRPGAEPFAVVSSGTWTIVLAHGGDLGRLRQERDMLAGVDAFGAPVATARFMGGREYNAIAGNAATPTMAGLAEVLRHDAMALPSFAAGGPFQGSPGRLLRADALMPDGRAALASLYLALLTSHALGLLAAAGDVVVDGPLAGNTVFTAVLAAFRHGDRVLASPAGAASLGARALVAGTSDAPPELRRAEPALLEGLGRYRDRWREAVANLAKTSATG